MLLANIEKNICAAKRQHTSKLQILANYTKHIKMGTKLGHPSPPLSIRVVAKALICRFTVNKQLEHKIYTALQ